MFNPLTPNVSYLIHAVFCEFLRLLHHQCDFPPWKIWINWAFLSNFKKMPECQIPWFCSLVFFLDSINSLDWWASVACFDFSSSLWCPAFWVHYILAEYEVPTKHTHTQTRTHIIGWSWSVCLTLLSFSTPLRTHFDVKNFVEFVEALQWGKYMGYWVFRLGGQMEVSPGLSF